jgi:hypothetical protein
LTQHPFQLRVGILGCPSRPDVAWTRDNLARLLSLGFNTMQLNIAWGARPADEPLNLEDVVELPTSCHHLESDRIIPTMADTSPPRRDERKAQLRERIALCKELGIRTIFHFGAPNNGWGHPDCLEYLNGQLPRCLLDDKTHAYYICLLEAFAAAYPGVDDLLMYTFDQAAWLCDEFGGCPNCRGVPLHKRAPEFVNRLAQTWRRLNPQGRLWWEPWELSAGQVLRCVEQLDPQTVGLALHTNIAEAQVTIVADRWFKNTVTLAASLGIPVIAENFLGAASEEVEPYHHLAYPLVILNLLRTVSQVFGVIGIKEYYGLLPDQEDPNLRAVGAYFQDPEISDQTLLDQLAQPYGRAAAEVARFWGLSSSAMEIFPWDASWFIREIGKSDPCHALSAAFLRGYCAETPSWLSTRDAIFMKVNNDEPHPWMLEDVQLRCEMAAARLQTAIDVGRAVYNHIPENLCDNFSHTLSELEGMRTRVLAYAYHIRASNLAMILRRERAESRPYPQRLVDELSAVLRADQANMPDPHYLAPAIELLQANIDAFLDTYLTPTENEVSKGYFSLTSR